MESMRDLKYAAMNVTFIWTVSRNGCPMKILPVILKNTGGIYFSASRRESEHLSKAHPMEKMLERACL